MRSGAEYSHARFMDCTFIARQVIVLPAKVKFKAVWLVRGREVGVITRHELSREKLKEFRPTGHALD